MEKCEVQPGAWSLVGWEPKSVLGKSDFYFIFTAESLSFLLVAIEKKLIMEMSICPFFYVTFYPGGEENEDKLSIINHEAWS